MSKWRSSFSGRQITDPTPSQPTTLIVSPPDSSRTILPLFQDTLVASVSCVPGTSPRFYVDAEN